MFRPKRLYLLLLLLTLVKQIQTLREVRNGYVNTDEPPASTLVEVKRLAREEFLIEIEAIAVVVP